MIEPIKKAVKHITRSWEAEPTPPHPKLRVLPPFLIELLGYLLLSAIIYGLVSLLSL